MRSRLLVAVMHGILCTGCWYGGGQGGDDAGSSDSGAGSSDCQCGEYDQGTGLCWQDPSVSWFSWNEAVQYCEWLETGGHDDWHLPTRDELMTLFDECEQHGSSCYDCLSCGDSATCGELFGADQDWYWSSTGCEEGQAWYAYFEYGLFRCCGHNADCHSVEQGYHVRCVRSVQ
ncbi:MAG: DUF1566 domain-containing protein [Polyangia bacterium]